MGVLDRINKALLKPKSLVLGFEPQFTVFEENVNSFGAVYKSLKLKENYKFAVEEFVLFIENNPKHKIVYIDNPSNPTGQIIPLKEIEKVAKVANVLIVDEAYGEFMPKKNSAVNLLKDFDTVIVTRSFSKGFGLAGLRIGYGIMNKKFGKLYEKARLPFEFNIVGLEVAFKALQSNLIAESIPKIKAEKKFLIVNFKKLGFEIAQTDLSVPIFLAKCSKIPNLKKVFSERGILTGEYATKTNNEVRIRIPGSMKKCREIIKRISN